MYSTTPSTISLVLGTATQIPLASTMPSLNTTYTPANSITVTQAGIYEINFFLDLSVSVATTLTIAIRNNGTNITDATFSRILTVGTQSIYSGSIIIDLTANSVIDMAASALLALSVTLGGGVNATLTVKQIG